MGLGLDMRRVAQSHERLACDWANGSDLTMLGQVDT